MKVAQSSPILLSRASAADGKPAFTLPVDGWIMLVPKGDFAGILRSYQNGAEIREEVVQRFDDAGLASMADDWKARAAEPNFPGMLVDFDHFSHHQDKPTEAAGWVEEVELRDDGLWGRVRWTALGRSRVEGGEYRLVSPVLSEIETLDGEGDPTKPVVRPRRIDRLALTNDPKLRGMPPVANRCGDPSEKQTKQRDQAMNPRDLLCQILGLSTDCTDDELTAAAQKVISGKAPAEDMEAMRNRATRAESLAADLRNRVKALEAEAIESDVRVLLPRFGGDEAKLRDLLTMNRQAVRETILNTNPDASGSMRKPGTTAPKHSTTNRNTPGNADVDDGGGSGPSVPTDAEAAKITTRAHELVAQKGYSFNRAFCEAKDEWARSRRAAAV